MREDNFIKLKDGRRLCYREYGDPKGKPVFYFHGWPASRLSGSETKTAALKLGVRVISPDRPGFGMSDYQANRTLLDWAKDLNELADSLGIKKFAVMGVSGGGPYAAVCAYKIPQRITKAGIVVGLAPLNVKGLTKGISTASRIGWENYHKFPLLRFFAAWIGIVQFKYFPVLGRVISFRAKSDRVLIKARSKKVNFTASKEAYRQGIKGAAQELKIYTDDWGFKLKDTKTKVFLWYGAKDKNVSLKMGEYYHSQIKNSKLFVNWEGGHLFRLEHEEEILKTLSN